MTDLYHMSCFCLQMLCWCLGVSAERDAFDTLFDHAPDKLNVVKRVCILFLSFTLHAAVYCGGLALD